MQSFSVRCSRLRFLFCCAQAEARLSCARPERAAEASLIFVCCLLFSCNRCRMVGRNMLSGHAGAANLLNGRTHVMSPRGAKKGFGCTVSAFHVTCGSIFWCHDVVTYFGLASPLELSVPQRFLCSGCHLFSASHMESSSEHVCAFPPACSGRSRRRTVLEKAAVGTMHIRDAFRLSSSASALSSPTSVPLTLRQESMLLLWSRGELDAALQAWKDFVVTSSPLLFLANVALLPADFASVFALPELPDERCAEDTSRFAAAVVCALEAGSCWWQQQELLHRRT